MKKIAPKSSVKNIIKKIVDDALSKIIDVATENGYKIVLNKSWNELSDWDFTHFTSAEEIIADDLPFAVKTYDSLSVIAEDLANGQLTLVTDDEIKAFSKKFLVEKAAYEKDKKRQHAEEIETLQRRIAKAQRRLDRLLAE